MNQVPLNYVKGTNLIPVRNSDHKLIGLRIGVLRCVQLKYFTKEAREYILSIHPLELSSLEKELL
jgi:hypothetical protein